MPAQFTFYTKISESNAPPTIYYESSDKKYKTFGRTSNIYNNEDLETCKIIGTKFVIYNTILVDDENIQAFTSTSYKFNENSGLPFGNDNILVVDSKFWNGVINNITTFGIKIASISTSSTGEFANQTGYEEYIKDGKKIFAQTTIYFPLPIVTYTNAFNSLPQPSTAPLPS